MFPPQRSSLTFPRYCASVLRLLRDQRRVFRVRFWFSHLHLTTSLSATRSPLFLHLNTFNPLPSNLTFKAAAKRLLTSTSGAEVEFGLFTTDCLKSRCSSLTDAQAGFCLDTQLFDSLWSRNRQPVGQTQTRHWSRSLTLEQFEFYHHPSVASRQLPRTRT